MNFKVYSSKFIDYALNFIHFLFQIQTLCFDVRRKIFEVQRLNLWKSNSNLWNSKHCFQDWNYILWNSNFNLRHSKLFFEIQTLIIELQRMKFKLLNIPRQKGGDLTQSYDKSPYTHGNVKRAVTTQTTPQKSSIKQRLRTDLGRSVGVTTATQLVWFNNNLKNSKLYSNFIVQNILWN